MKNFLKNHLLFLFFLVKSLKRILYRSYQFKSSLQGSTKTKLIALIIINCFLLSCVYGQSIAQVVQNTISTQQFKHILSEFFIPNSLGKITSSNFSASDTIAINIQDLDLHPNVQKNIASIIELFDKKYGTKMSIWKALLAMLILLGFLTSKTKIQKTKSTRS
jgi:hypothetical protein